MHVEYYTLNGDDMKEEITYFQKMCLVVGKWVSRRPLIVKEVSWWVCMELTVYKFIKRELQSITNEEIADTLKTLCEMRLIENKPSNGKSSYFLIDNV